MGSLVYESLHPKHSFCLFRLVKGHKSTIQCELFHATIHDADYNIDYEALSYTWGSAIKSRNIEINGSQMSVTESLHQALQHLRHEHEDRILWVDAICINQDDQLERGHQVQQMSSIYENARQVVIWLGPASGVSDSVFDLIQRLGQVALEYACNDWRPTDERWRSLWSTITLWNTQDVADQDQKRQCLVLLLRRDWFKRVWVLQEVAKARAATIMCGTKSASARIFAVVPPLLGIKPDYHSQSVLDIMPGPSRKYSWWTENRDLETLLYKFSESEASDSRDLIYALLGISSDANDTDVLLPDYSKSEEEVVQGTLVFMLDAHHHGIPVNAFPEWSSVEFRHNLQSIRGRLFPWALEEGHQSLAETLLETLEADPAALNVNFTDSYGRSPLCWAAIQGQELCARVLLKAGADTNTHDWLGQSPLSLAAENGHEGVVRALLDVHRIELEEPDVNSRDWRGRTPLAWAAGKGYESIVRMLLGTGKADINSQEKSGWTALYLAVHNEHQAIVELLKAYALNSEDYDQKKDLEGQQPLSSFLALASGRIYPSELRLMMTHEL